MENSNKGIIKSSFTDSMTRASSEAKLLDLILQAPVLINTFIGPTFIVETINKIALEIWGKSYEQVINKPFFDSSPELEKTVKKILNDVYASGKPFMDNEISVQFKRIGKPDLAYFNMVYQPLYDVDNTIYGILVVGTEVTETVNTRKKMEEKTAILQREHQMLQNYYIEAPAFFVILKGEEHIFEFANTMYHQLIGNRDILGKKMMEVLPELKGQGFDVLVDEIHRTGKPFTGREMPASIEQEKGKLKQIYIDLHCQAIKNDENYIEGILIFGYDVTELVVARKLIEASEKRFSNILSQSLMAIAIFKGKDMIIDFVNEPLLKIWGKGPDIIGKPLFEVMPELKSQRFPKELNEVYTKGIPFSSNENSAILIRNGIPEECFFSAVYQPYTEVDNTITGVTVIGAEITDYVRAKKQIEENIALAETARQMAEEAKIKAETATEIAEKAVMAKQQFLSNMSHEIRTPMNVIIGFTKVLMKTELTEKQKEYLQAIKSSGNTLIVLINDILDLAKVDAGKMIFIKSPFKISESITTVLHLFETKVQEKNLELVKEYDARIPEILLGDSVRLHQILINLLGNAIKFTAKGKIIVSVNLLKEDREKVTLEIKVTDTGIGIPQNKIGTIFENFEQVHAIISSLYGGTGLGLAIVKQLVEKQGGTISVISKVDEGSTFNFTLSFQKTTAEVAVEKATRQYETEIHPLKVLVVEDVKLNQLLMKTILDDFKFVWDMADNGKIAIEKLQINTYDIILMDLQMPIMNGFEATEYIRNNMKLQTPIIALTADVTTADKEKCKTAGMNDYISKPLNEKLLYSKILNLVKSE